jgi:hypothetical protein
MTKKSEIDKFKEAARAQGAPIVSKKDFNAALKDIGAAGKPVRVKKRTKRIK